MGSVMNNIEASTSDKLFNTESLSNSIIVRENQVMLVNEKGDCNIRAYFSRVPAHLLDPELLKDTKEALYYSYFWVEIRATSENGIRKVTKWEEEKVLARIRSLLTYHSQGDLIETYDVPTCFPVVTKLLRYYKR